MIEIKNLTKKYGEKYAISNVNFTVNEGEILGFLGPNGAGKTTTMNIITGYLSATSGTAKVDGIDILESPTEVKKKIGFLPEQPPLYMDMTVKDYLDFIYDLKKCRIKRSAHIRDICSLIGIEDVYNRAVRNLSKGYKQRVGLAQALIGNPKVLIMDEPTVGLDPKQIIEIRNLIKHLGKNHTVILSSHILPEVQAVCERVVVIDHGKIVANDTTDKLSSSMTRDTKLQIRVVGPSEEVTKVLKAIPGLLAVKNIVQKEDDVYEYDIDSELTTDPIHDIRRKIFYAMSRNNWPLIGMKNLDMSLEDIFLRLIKTENHEVQVQVQEGGKS